MDVTYQPKDSQAWSNLLVKKLVLLNWMSFSKFKLLFLEAKTTVSYLVDRSNSRATVEAYIHPRRLQKCGQYSGVLILFPSFIKNTVLSWIGTFLAVNVIN